MRTVAIVALTTLILSWSATPSAAQNRIPWLTDWRQARDAAKDQQRLVLLHFYSDNCPPCRRLEQRVFNRPEVARAMGTGYIPVKINVDQQPQLAKFYRVEQWPTDVIVAPNGREVSRSSPSPADSNGYIALLDTVRAHYATGLDAPPPTQVAGLSRDRNPSGYGARSQSSYLAAGDGEREDGSSSYGSSYTVGNTTPQASRTGNPGVATTARRDGSYGPPSGHAAGAPYGADNHSGYGGAWGGQGGAGQAGAQPTDPGQNAASPYAGNQYDGNQYAGNQYAGNSPTANPYGAGRQETGYGHNYAQAGAGQGYGPDSPRGTNAAPQAPFGGEPTQGYAADNGGYGEGGGGYGNQNRLTSSQGFPTGPNAGPGSAPRGGYDAQADGYGGPGDGTPGYGTPGYGDAGTQDGYGNQSTNGPQGGYGEQGGDGAEGEPARAGGEQAAGSQFSMDGYCPVTLVLMNEWAPGDLKWGATHQGRTYLFTSREYRDQFLADPNRFAPVLSGYDPVRYAESGQLVDGKRKHGVFYGNMIYLFADEASLNRFSKHPQFYVNQVRQAMQTQQTMAR